MCQNEEQRIIKELLVFLKDETFQVGSRLSSHWRQPNMDIHIALLNKTRTIAA